jgi:hypothetical protein
MKLNKGFEPIGTLFKIKPFKNKSLTHFLADEVVKVCGKPTTKNEWLILLSTIKRIGQDGVYRILGEMKEGKVCSLKLFVWKSRGIKK